MPTLAKPSLLTVEARLIINQKGASLVEVVLTSALLVLLLAALASVLIYGRESVRLAGDRDRALLLAAEGLEATRNIRDNGFSNLIDGSHGLATSSNQWIFSGTSDTRGIFTRQITISSIDPSRKQIVSQVSWQQTPQRTGTVSLTTRLNDWSAGLPVVIFMDCSEYCVTLNYSSGICRQNSQQCSNNNEVHQAGGDQYCPVNPNTDTCCCF